MGTEAERQDTRKAMAFDLCNIIDEIPDDDKLTKEDIKKIKNNLHLLKADQRKIYLTLLKKMEEEYNSYPLMCNFNSLKKQLQNMVLPFTQFEF